MLSLPLTVFSKLFLQSMIKSFKHKGLERFFNTGSTAGVNVKQAKKLRLILALLDSASTVEDVDAPGLKLHQLKGNRQNDYSVRVSGNWRMTFQFKEGHAYIVNYEDYH